MPMSAAKQAIFDALPQSVAIVVAGNSVTADKREFSTGSIGYNFSGKLQIGGQKLQVGINLTVPHSKEL